MSKKAKTMSDVENQHDDSLDGRHAGSESGASVDKIRDILFGSQLKNYEARFARLEENLVRETVELKETMQRRSPPGSRPSARSGPTTSALSTATSRRRTRS
jgi:hypothetical protein